MPVVLDMLLFLAILFVFSSIGGYCVTKFIPQDVKVALRPVSQQTFNVTGMMFAILLGFFIAQSMRDYTNSHSDIINEANSLGEVFRDARGFSEVDRVRIRTLCRQYADSVINDEWNLLVENKEN